MTKNLFRYFGALAAAAALLAVSACSLVVAPAAKDAAGDTATVSVSWSVPAIAGPLAAGFPSNGGRAYMFAHYVTIDVTQNGVSAGSAAFAPTSVGPGGNSKATFTLKAYEQYTVRIDVYNGDPDVGGILTHQGSTVFNADPNWTNVTVPVLPVDYYDAGTVPTNAFQVSRSGIVTSVLTGTTFTTVGTENWVKFTAGSAGAVDITVDPVTANDGDMVYVGVYDGAGRYRMGQPSSRLIDPAMGNDVATLKFGVTAGASYYIGVIGLHDDGGDQRNLDFDMSVAPSAVGEADMEDNDAWDSASNLGASPINGTAYDADWYYFYLNQADTISLNVQFPQPVTGTVRLVYGYGTDNTIWQDRTPDFSPKTTFSVSDFALDNSGPYYIEINVRSLATLPSGAIFMGSAGEYQMNYAIGTPPPQAPAAPTGVSAAPIANASQTGVMVSWNPVDGATGYYITRFADVSLSTQEYQDNVMDGAASSYSDWGLNQGTTHYYTVTAYNAEGNSQPSASATATTPDSYYYEIVTGTSNSWFGGHNNGTVNALGETVYIERSTVLSSFAFYLDFFYTDSMMGTLPEPVTVRLNVWDSAGNLAAYSDAYVTGAQTWEPGWLTWTNLNTPLAGGQTYLFAAHIQGAESDPFVYTAIWADASEPYVWGQCYEAGTGDLDTASTYSARSWDLRFQLTGTALAQ
jgi:hypothetical protein